MEKKILSKFPSDTNKINRKKSYKGNIKKLNIKRNFFINILELSIILILFPLFFLQEIRFQLTTLQFYSEIKLEIKGSGTQRILNAENTYSEYEYEGSLPDQLFINGVSQPINKKMIYNLPDEYNNNITLIWDSPLDSTSYMFYGMSNISKIVVSHFDSTNLKKI